MADVFSNEQPAEHFVSIEEVDGKLTLRVHGDTTHGTTAVIRIAVDGEDLARALITASPSFTAAIGEFAQLAILSALYPEK